MASERPAAALVARRGSRTIGPVPVGQVLVVEAAALAVAALAGVGVRALAVAGVAGLLLTALALTRRSGRWLPQALRLAVDVRRRARVLPVAEADARLAELRRLAPRLAVQDVVDGGSPVGVAYDGEGWFVAVLVTPRPRAEWEPDLDPPDAVPPAALARLLDAVPVAASAQVVTLTAPAGPGADGVPHRTTWVALRLDARSLAEGEDAQARAPRGLLQLARRLPRALHAAGFAASVLDADGLVAALASACRPGPADADADGAGAETTRSWSSGGLRHVGFWVQEWPPAGEEQALLDELADAPGTATAVSYRITPEGGGRVDVQGLVRVAAPGDAVGDACDRLMAVAQLAGARLFRLDGEHAPAAYATAPTGGGPR